MSKKASLLLIIGLSFLYISPSLFGEEKNFIQRFQERQSSKNFRFTPLLGPAYTPEMKFLIAGGFLFSFSTDEDNKDLQRSSLPITLGISSNGSLVFTSTLNSFWADDFIRFQMDLNLKNMPDNYWGVGYQAASSQPANENTAYNRLWWQFTNRIYFRFLDNFYYGFSIDFNQTVASDVSDQMANDPYYQEYGSTNFNDGMGPLLLYDSRDVAVNAYRGIYADARWLLYSDYYGSDNNYQVVSLDYRQYHTIKREGSTLAWQVKSRYSFGDVPYGELSELGSPNDLRGYTWGQYRDKVYLYGLLEYRYMFLNKKEKISPFGVVGWLGLGSIGPELKDLSLPLWNAGFGLRLQVQPRMNLRLDFGFGKDSFGFYFNFNEAF